MKGADRIVIIFTDEPKTDEPSDKDPKVDVFQKLKPGFFADTLRGLDLAPILVDELPINTGLIKKARAVVVIGQREEITNTVSSLRSMNHQDIGTKVFLLETDQSGETNTATQIKDERLSYVIEHLRRGLGFNRTSTAERRQSA